MQPIPHSQAFPLSARSLTPVGASDRAQMLARLSEQIEGIQNGSLRYSTAASTGWDVALTRGAIHEWFDQPCEDDGASLPPLSVLGHLVRRVFESDQNRHVVWIGRRCWPYPQALIAGADHRLLDQSLFIDPPNHAQHVWAIDTVLRCPAVFAVIADGSGLTMAESRRLQLATTASDGLGFLVRPAWELNAISAARTRWVVCAAPSPTNAPRWIVRLLRCKGLQPTSDKRQWVVQPSYETGGIHLVPDVVDRRAASPRSALGQSA